MKVVFDHSREESANIRTFYFHPEKPVYFTAGQYAEWTFQHPKPDKRGVKRWFSISSSPTDELVSLTTKVLEKDSSSYKKGLGQLKPGDEAQMSEPMGDFVLPKFIQTPLVFIALGIGITPFHSILSWLAATGEKRPIKFLYAVQNEEEIIFQETFDKSGVHPTITVAEPSDQWGGERGLLNAELIMGLEKPTEDTLVYISGPEPKIEQLEKDLIKAGLKKHQLVLDSFLGYN